jgi:uroporphyrinogen-III synthase
MTDSECDALKQPHGCLETYTIPQFIAKVQKEENYDFAIVISPLTAKNITDQMKDLQAELDACKAGG